MTEQLLPGELLAKMQEDYVTERMTQINAWIRAGHPMPTLDDRDPEPCPYCQQIDAFCKTNECHFTCANPACGSGGHFERWHCTLQDEPNGANWVCVYCCGHDGACAERAGRA